MESEDRNPYVGASGDSREAQEALLWDGCLHDARLERLDIDWVQRTACLVVGDIDAEDADVDEDGPKRRAQVTIRGLLFCAVDPPISDAARGYDPAATVGKGLWIDGGEGDGYVAAAKLHWEAAPTGPSMPQIPAGYSLHWIFVRDWNAFIHVCGTSVDLAWLDVTP